MALPAQSPTEIDPLARDQYQSAYNPIARWGLYKLSEPYVNHYEAAGEDLDFQPGDTVLDVGCLAGDGLMQAVGPNFQGSLVGDDIDEGLFTTRTMNKNNAVGPIKFVVGSAESLPLATNSVDKAMAMFVIYHTLRPETALEELGRVTKPGGKIAVATVAPTSKKKHRAFEAAIGEYLGATPPPVFAARFNSKIAETVLPTHFDIESTLSVRSRVPITPERIEVYLNSLMTYRSQFDPYPEELKVWNEAVDRVVLPAINEEIVTNGEFVDNIDWDLFICRNSLHRIRQSNGRSETASRIRSNGSH